MARKMSEQSRQQGVVPAVIVAPTPQQEEDEQEVEETAEGQVDTGKDPEDPTGSLEASAAPAPSTSASTSTVEITAYMTKMPGLCNDMDRVGYRKERTGIS